MVSNPERVGLLGSIERCFELGGRDVAAVAVEPGRVVPVDPRQGGELDVVNGPPRSPALGGPADQLGLVEPVDRFGEGIIEALTG